MDVVSGPTVVETMGVVDETIGVDAAEVVEEDTGESEYTFSLSGPPQNSELFPEQTIVQPDGAGCPPFW